MASFDFSVSSVNDGHGYEPRQHAIPPYSSFFPSFRIGIGLSPTAPLLFRCFLISEFRLYRRAFYSVPFWLR